MHFWIDKSRGNGLNNRPPNAHMGHHHFSNSGPNGNRRIPRHVKRTVERQERSPNQTQPQSQANIPVHSVYPDHELENNRTENVAKKLPVYTIILFLICLMFASTLLLLKIFYNEMNSLQLSIFGVIFLVYLICLIIVLILRKAKNNPQNEMHPTTVNEISMQSQESLPPYAVAINFSEKDFQPPPSYEKLQFNQFNPQS